MIILSMAEEMINQIKAGTNKQKRNQIKNYLLEIPFLSLPPILVSSWSVSISFEMLRKYSG